MDDTVPPLHWAPSAAQWQALEQRVESNAREIRAIETRLLRVERHLTMVILAAVSGQSLLQALLSAW